VCARLLILAGLGACLLAPAANAEIGPCKPDNHESFICGEGDGAARVIEGTLSPSKQYAFAWRTPEGPPTEEPDDDKIEFLLIRLKDGAVLLKNKTPYWATGEMHVNRLQEQASWSPNSRYVVRAFQSRFETGNVDLYVVGPKGDAAGEIDLMKPMSAAITAQLKRRVKNPEDYSFSLSAGPQLKIDNDGRLRGKVMMWIPKNGPYYYYTVSMQITPAASGLAARVVAITPSRE
jgi:hypothetical protein